MSVSYAPTKLRVPEGFEHLIEGLAREVLREQPKDIIAFAAEFFRKKLMVREVSQEYVTDIASSSLHAEDTSSGLISTQEPETGGAEVPEKRSSPSCDEQTLSVAQSNQSEVASTGVVDDKAQEQGSDLMSREKMHSEEDNEDHEHANKEVSELNLNAGEVDNEENKSGMVDVEGGAHSDKEAGQEGESVCEEEVGKGQPGDVETGVGEQGEAEVGEGRCSEEEVEDAGQSEIEGGQPREVVLEDGEQQESKVEEGLGEVDVDKDVVGEGKGPGEVDVEVGEHQEDDVGEGGGTGAEEKQRDEVHGGGDKENAEESLEISGGDQEKSTQNLEPSDTEVSQQEGSTTELSTGEAGDSQEAGGEVSGAEQQD